MDLDVEQKEPAIPVNEQEEKGGLSDLMEEVMEHQKEESGKNKQSTANDKNANAPEKATPKKTSAAQLLHLQKAREAKRRKRIEQMEHEMFHKNDIDFIKEALVEISKNVGKLKRKQDILEAVSQYNKTNGQPFTSNIPESRKKAKTGRPKLPTIDESSEDGSTEEPNTGVPRVHPTGSQTTTTSIERPSSTFMRLGYPEYLAMGVAVVSGCVLGLNRFKNENKKRGEENSPFYMPL